jgi:hypothetical protein
MFDKPFHTVNGQLRWLLAKALGGARSFWEWYRDLGNGNESEARGLRLLREWLSPKQLAQYQTHILTSLAAIPASATGYGTVPKRISKNLMTQGGQKLVGVLYPEITSSRAM